jgi:drug/metabolite transporter (DMT)-like permease
MIERSRSLLQVHGAVLLFGLAGLFGKLLPFSPVAIVFGRVVFAAPALLLAAALLRLPLRPPSRRGLLAFAALGLLLAVHWTTFFQAVQVSSVAVALIGFATFPVFAALLEPALFRERLRAADVALALLALAGIAILVPSFEPDDQTTQGAIWGIVSGLTFALLSLLNRKYVRQYSSITIALYQDAFAAGALLPFVLEDWPSLTVHDVLLLLVLGVLCTAVAHALFIAGLRHLPARTAARITCLEPVYGSLLAALLLREIPSLRTALGGFVVVAVAFYATLHPGGEATRQA